MQQHCSKYFARRHPPILDGGRGGEGLGSIGQKSPFSEHGHVAYKITVNHEMQQHGSNMLPLWEYVIVLCLICNCSMFCCTLLYVHSSFAIILMGKRELVDLLSLSSWCLVMFVWLLLAVQWVCLRFVIVAFPDHTHCFYGCKCTDYFNFY